MEAVVDVITVLLCSVIFVFSILNFILDIRLDIRITNRTSILLLLFAILSCFLVVARLYHI